MLALHHGGITHKAMIRAAGHWGEVNEARAEADDLTFDGLVIEAALDAATETEPTVAMDKLTELIAVADSMRAEIALTLAEFEDDEDE
jgi:hypothetical protein